MDNTYLTEVAPHMPAAFKRLRASLDIAAAALETGNFVLAATAFVDLRTGAGLTADILAPFIDVSIESAEQAIIEAAKMQAELDIELRLRGADFPEL